MDNFEICRFLFQRSLGGLYFIAFLAAAFQLPSLIGSHGLQPAPLFLKHTSIKKNPSLFHFYFSDRFLSFICGIGGLLSLLALTGLVENFKAAPFFLWALLWILYLSIVNVGQTFYSFGWESLLLETGFLAIFLGSSSFETSSILIFLIRWVLFRVMFGAGLIKLRGDKCWWDLTCLQYHYETQPMPHPFSWYLHHLPASFHKLSVVFTHGVELIVPWGYFLPPPFCYIAGLLTFVFQFFLILSGNLSWLNYLTLILTLSCFDDSFFKNIFSWEVPSPLPQPFIYQIIIFSLMTFILIRSIRPTLNLFSCYQRMNACYDPFHLVNTYGAFGSISKRRFEIIIEGSNELDGEWKEYEFKGKPGNIYRRPCFIAPYHYRLDWQMWFAAMSHYSDHPWILGLVKKILQGDKHLLKLLAFNPFSEAPPKYIRAKYYRYAYTNFGQSAWWSRDLLGDYLPPLTLSDFY